MRAQSQGVLQQLQNSDSADIRTLAKRLLNNAESADAVKLALL